MDTSRVLIAFCCALLAPPALAQSEAPRDVVARLVFAIEPEPMPDEAAADCKRGATKVSDITLDDLPNETVSVTIRSTQKSGKVSYLLAGVARKGETYTVMQDYMKYCSVTYDDGTVSRYGIGLRIRADVVVKSSDVNLNGLAALGYAASTSRIAGSLAVEVIGISGRDVTNALPMPTQLSQETIIGVVQAIATIKARIYGDAAGPKPTGGAHITIQEIARSLAPDQIDSQGEGTVTTR